MAEVSYLTTSVVENPLYSEEMRVFDFLQQPGEALIQALLLKFQPNFMDVLPLYIVLLLAFSARSVVAVGSTDSRAWPLRRALFCSAIFQLESAGLSDQHMVL